mgnify:CR=1 FL=1
MTAAPPVASSHWQLLAGGLEPVDAALLYSWSALPPDGDHVLRLTGRDAAGSRTSAAVPIRVDTTPPAAPTSLQAQVESDDVALQVLALRLERRRVGGFAERRRRRLPRLP